MDGGVGDEAAMDDIDRALLDLVQTELPLAPRPFAQVGERLGLAEADVLDRLRRLKQAGIVRRVGAVVSPRKIGWVSTLVACRVDPERVDQFAAVVNQYPEVTHNYEREHGYNVWFTLIARDRRRVQDILAELRGRLEVRALYEAPAQRRFKIRAAFELGTGDTDEPAHGD